MADRSFSGVGGGTDADADANAGTAATGDPAAGASTDAGARGSPLLILSRYSLLELVVLFAIVCGAMQLVAGLAALARLPKELREMRQQVEQVTRELERVEKRSLKAQAALAAQNANQDAKVAKFKQELAERNTSGSKDEARECVVAMYTPHAFVPRKLT
jgi:Sec-independent protein translocase protein TatA